MRLIDADELIEKYGGWYTEEGTEDGFIGVIEALVNAMPSVQPEIIRCKECKYRDADDFCTGRGYPNALVPDDGFCDKGERREDG